MLNLQQIFSIKAIILFLISVILVATLSYTYLKDILVKRYQVGVENEMNIISLLIPYHKDDLDSFAKLVHQNTNFHTTFLDKNGIIIGSSHESIIIGDDYSSRPEVIEVMQTKTFAHNVRDSRFDGEEYLFSTDYLEIDGEAIILRVGLELTQIDEYLMIIWKTCIVIFIIIVIVGLVISWLLNRQITNEVEHILSRLNSISRKKYHTKPTKSFALEFFKINYEITNLAKKLNKRDKQKQKYISKIKLYSQQRTDIISAISHEFKNPIASIIGYSQTVLDDHSMDAQLRDRFLKKIISNSKKVDTMINRLSLATKLESNDLSTTMRDVDMERLILSVIENFKQRHPHRTFVTHLQTLHVEADLHLMEAVLNNIIENCIKYSEGIITINITDDEKVEICDRGKGISPENLTKITKKFFREDPKTWDNSMGLGLFIVNYILALHSSELEIESELEYGSKFSFKLYNNATTTKDEENV